MNFKLFLCVIVTITIMPIISIGQSRRWEEKKEESQSYSGPIDENMALFRGRVPTPYKFLHKGTYYAYKKEFIDGTLKYNGVEYQDILMNLNSHLDEMYVMSKSSSRTIVLNPDFFEFAHFDSGYYIYVRNAQIADGYYEILYSGKVSLYKKNIKVFSEKIGDYVDAQTNSRIIRSFTSADLYYLKKDGKFYPIKKRSSIISLFKSNRQEIRRFIRENNLNSREGKTIDYIYAKIVEYADNL